MHFETLYEFLLMGGYASYVWSAFGLTFLSMLVLLLISLRKKRILLAEVQARVDRQARIDAASEQKDTL
jgi:heme exporter protein D